MRQMPIEDLSLAEIAKQGAAAIGLGLLARLIYLTGPNRPPSLRALLYSLAWETPCAMGLGLLGWGVAEHMQIGGFAQYAVVIAVVYTGPRFIDLALGRLFDSNAKKKG